MFGGGVMNRKIIFNYMRAYFIEMLGEYVDHPLMKKENISGYLKAPKLGGSVGVKGAMMIKYMKN